MMNSESFEVLLILTEKICKENSIESREKEKEIFMSLKKAYDLGILDCEESKTNKEKGSLW